jgi:HTH-like domain
MSGKAWPVSLMCEALEVSASGYVNWKRGQDEPDHGSSRFQSDEALLAHMRAIHAEIKGEYGWPHMHKELLARGIRVGKERVRVLIQRHGIKARTKRKFVVITDSKHHLPVAPDLVQRRFNPEAPNVLWSGDITYIATDEGWLYLAAVLDLHSRHIDEPQRQLLGQRAHRELLGASEGGLRAGAKVCHPRAGQGRHPGLDGLLQSRSPAFGAGLPQPHTVRATLAGGSAQEAA